MSKSGDLLERDVSKRNRKILAVGAHPDDIELGCAGALRKHILKGDKVYYVIASYGEKSGSKKERIRETHLAAKLMGAEEVYFLNLPDTMIKHNGKTVSLLDRYIKKIKPDLIYVHTPKDAHQDHRDIAYSVLSAARQMKEGILYYETPSTTIEFKPTAYIDISSAFEHKVKCLEKFKSQKRKDYMKKEMIKGLAKYRGNTLGVKFAEAFEVGRLFEW